MLPLEKALHDYCQNSQSPSSSFPTPGANYYEIYKSIKDHLTREGYGWISAGAAANADRGVILTDHGPEHFNSVINFAGLLLGLDDENTSPAHHECLKPYEIFLLLSAILIHDIGNALGRDKHEKWAFPILEKLGTAKQLNNFERILIAKIAESHTGTVETAGITSRDTIGARLLEFDSIGRTRVRPRLLAGILRLADEICEDFTRTSALMDSLGRFNGPSAVYHAYASSVVGVDYDRISKTVRLQYVLKEDQVTKTVQKGEGNVFLIDEIMSRLDKMDLERIYCSRFIRDVIKIDRIRASIEILAPDNYTTVDSIIFELQDEGYPGQSNALCTRYPKWCGAALAEKISQKGETHV